MVVMDEEKLVCPRCGSDERYVLGKTDRRKQMYQCKKCGRRYMKPEDYKVYPKMPCQKCGSVNTRKAGRRILSGGATKQRYRCKDCNHSFYIAETDTSEEAEGR